MLRKNKYWEKLAKKNIEKGLLLIKSIKGTLIQIWKSPFIFVLKK